jgi:CelD/BcsL family acetyltransferase involved in cellulose biosynthesis
MKRTALTWQNLAANQLREDADLACAWDGLNASRLDLPFLASHAVATALQCLGQGDERLLVGSDVDGVAAMFVVQRCGIGRWQTFQPSQVPLGIWVARPEHELPDLSDAALRNALGACLVFSVTQVDPRMADRPDDGPTSTASDYIETAWVDIAGSFDDYWAARGKNLRANMRKQRNRLEAEGVVAELKVLEQRDEMTAALARYGQLESAGWKSDQGTAIHPDNAQGRFYLQLLQVGAALGEAVVYEYLFDGRTVAMHLCLRRGQELVILKTTYDERIDKSLSPAFLLHEDELRCFFAQGQPERLEYYGRLMDWHTRWTGERRTLYHLTHYRWAWLKRLKRKMSDVEAATDVQDMLATVKQAPASAREVGAS